jgi:molybdopterin-containing oxidoreductase family membrane subunit
MNRQLQLPIFILALVGFVAGSYGLYDRLANGHVNAAYGSYVPWGLWVAMYIYLVGLSAGAFLFSTLVYVFNIHRGGQTAAVAAPPVGTPEGAEVGLHRLEDVGKLALFTALVTLFGAMFSIWLDLGHPLRAWKLLLQTNFSSIMGWMLWFYTAYFILLLVEFWLAIRADLVARSKTNALARFLTFGRTDVSTQALVADRNLLRILGTIGVPLAIAFHGGVGALFGVVGARPYWNSGITPIAFLAGALLSGGALLTFLTTLFGPAQGTADHRRLVIFLGKIVLGLLAFHVLLEWAEYSVIYYASIPAHFDALQLVLFGQYWWVFWIVYVLFGVVIPALLLVVSRNSASAIAAACFLIAFTFVAVRLNIVIPALALPEIEGLTRAFSGPGLSFEYFPTLTEWLFAIWVASLAVLVFLAGLRWLPVLSQPKEVA